LAVLRGFLPGQPPELFVTSILPETPLLSRKQPKGETVPEGVAAGLQTFVEERKV
jgi:hypothetical protein